jgi:hypothetical protein
MKTTPATRKYAPAREDGLCAYLVTTSSWGKAYTRIVWHSSLKAAKAADGWTRQMHTSVHVQRATTEHVEAHRG